MGLVPIDEETQERALSLSQDHSKKAVVSKPEKGSLPDTNPAEMLTLDFQLPEL